MNPLKAFPFEQVNVQRNYSPNNFVKKERPSQTGDMLKRSKSSGVLRKSSQNLTSKQNVLSNSKLNMPNTPSTSSQQQISVYAQKSKLQFSQNNIKRDTKNIINRKLNSLIVNNNEDPSSFLENNSNLMIAQSSKSLAKSVNSSSHGQNQHINPFERSEQNKRFPIIDGSATTIKNKHALKFRFTNDQNDALNQVSGSKFNINLSLKNDSTKNYSFSNSFLKLKGEEFQSNQNKNEKQPQNGNNSAGINNFNVQSPNSQQQQISNHLQQQQLLLQQYDKQNKQLQMIQEKQFQQNLEKQQLNQNPLQILQQQNHQNIEKQQQQQQQQQNPINSNSNFSNSNNNGKQVVATATTTKKLQDEQTKPDKQKESSQVPQASTSASQITHNIYQALLSSSIKQKGNDKNQGLAIGGTNSQKKNNYHSQSQDFSNILHNYQSAGKYNHYSQNQQQQRASSLDQNNVKQVIGMYAVKTKAGALPGKPVKTNQDSFIVQQNYMQKKNKFMFGVCDGHGINGHLVSQYVKKHLPINIEHYYKIKLQKGNESDVFMLKSALTTSFLKTQQDLVEGEIDVNFSGSTTVCLYISGNTIWCSNIGDSRAIIATQKGNTLVCKPLSIDQKPDNDYEHRRIINCGGRVEPFRDLQGKQMGPYRVWLKTENIPGLAMSRSFGDYVASQVGVISEPEITTHEISDQDKFIIVASDGVWEFLSNEQVINFVVPFYIRNDPEGACDKLIKEATEAWKKEDDVVDDITVIIVFLQEEGQGN